MADKNWKILDSRYIIRRPWLTARCDSVELPGGKIIPEYYILEYPAWVNVIAITEEGKYLMVRQYRHGLGDVFTELVAGVVENGEEPIDAARRELIEETGYSGDEWELLTVLSQNPTSTTNLTYCFVARNVRKVSDQNLDETEDIEILYLDRSEVLDLLFADKIKQSLMAAPLWKHFYLLSNLVIPQ